MEYNKLTILGVLPVSIGGRLTTLSIFDGFKQIGHRVFIFDELKDSNLKKFYKSLNIVPSFIVGYDFSPIKLKYENSLNIPCISYFSDEIRNKTSENWKNYLAYLSYDDNYTFYWDRELIKQENFKNLFYLPHFVNTNIYKNLHLQPETDVMFAGRLDTEYRLNIIESLAEMMPEVKFGWYAIRKHYEDALSRTKNKDIIKKIYRGFIDNEIDMSKAINKTKIVINMHSQGLSSLNYRSMQAIACEKLLISDARAELDLFDNRIPVYKNVEDLQHLISYYLNNDMEYKAITEYCSAIARQKYSSVNGAKYMLSKVKA